MKLLKQIGIIFICSLIINIIYPSNENITFGFFPFPFFKKSETSSFELKAESNQNYKKQVQKQSVSTKKTLSLYKNLVAKKEFYKTIVVPSLTSDEAQDLIMDLDEQINVAKKISDDDLINFTMNPLRKQRLVVKSVKIAMKNYKNVSIKDIDKDRRSLQLFFKKAFKGVELIAFDKADNVKGVKGKKLKKKINFILTQKGFKQKDYYSEEHVIDESYQRNNINDIISLVRPTSLNKKGKFPKFSRSIVSNNKNFRYIPQSLHWIKNDIQSCQILFNRYDKRDNSNFFIQKNDKLNAKKKGDEILQRIKEDTKDVIKKTKEYIKQTRKKN